MIEVERPTVSLFMGDWEANIPDIARVDGPGSAVDSGLRAIMFTDLAGYTALMGRDERRAIEALERSRAHIFRYVEAHGGLCREDEGDRAVDTIEKFISRPGGADVGSPAS